MLDSQLRRPSIPQVNTARVPHIKIVSCGGQGVGKSSLIKRFCEGRFIGKYVSTIGVDYGVKPVSLDPNDKLHVVDEILQNKDKRDPKDVEDSLNFKVHFWDLAGHPCFLEVRNEFYKLSQGIILVFSVVARQTFEGLDVWQQELHKYGGLEDSFVAVCGNKIDLGKRVVTEEEARNWAQSRGFMYFETSANSGEGVVLMFEALFVRVLQKVKDAGSV
eukprot:Phypoly_transcript_13127.p1 GENE.Phypoly_transcript_13127~~Phypoly_transcript_13127.p1  ORF type:complete len:218 (+),score=20.06 Phypoly_transcript_13127:145-798(+)